MNKYQEYQLVNHNLQRGGITVQFKKPVKEIGYELKE